MLLEAEHFFERLKIKVPAKQWAGNFFVSLTKQNYRN